MEDMCYERRRAEACVDESAHHALVTAYCVCLLRIVYCYLLLQYCTYSELSRGGGPRNEFLLFGHLAKVVAQVVVASSTGSVSIDLDRDIQNARNNDAPGLVFSPCPHRRAGSRC